MAGDADGTHRPDAMAGARVVETVQELARLQRECLEPRLDALSLSWGHDAVLRHLWENGPQRQVELARALHTDTSTMTRTLQRMEAGGWVLRTPHPGDRRATLVATSAQADRVRPALENIWAEALVLSHRAAVTFGGSLVRSCCHCRPDARPGARPEGGPGVDGGPDPV